MHPGPMNRGVEISSELADDVERSLITRKWKLVCSADGLS